MATFAHYDQYGIRQSGWFSKLLTSLAFIGGLLVAPIALVVAINALAEASSYAIYVTLAWTLGIPLTIAAISRLRRRSAEAFA